MTTWPHCFAPVAAQHHDRDVRWRKFRGVEEVGRAGRLGLTLKCASGTCDSEGGWMPVWALVC